MLNLFISLFLASAQAAPSPTPSLARDYQAFVDACISAFTQSAGNEEHGGKRICECSAEESKHQKVTVKELIHETAEIKKDFKYKIKNKKLLASIQYCTVLLMEEKEDRDHNSQ